jgi:hypothetical protein
MHRLVAFGLACSLLCAAQVMEAAPPVLQTPQAAIPVVLAHGSFPARITSALDSSKLRVGDVFEAETAGSFLMPDGTLVPKGAKLIGRVTAATARSKGDGQSALGIEFDRLNPPGGQPMKLRALVQAVYPAAVEVDPGTVNGPSMARDGGPGYVPPDIKVGSNLQSETSKDLPLSLQAEGVQGLAGLSLGPDGVVTSTVGKKVKLGRGYRLVVRVKIFE